MLQSHPILRYAADHLPGAGGVLVGHLAIDPFGSARPLWVLPILWWLYMFYGWMRLARNRAGKRSGAAYWGGFVLLAVLALSALGSSGRVLTVCWFFGIGAEVAWSRGLLGSLHQKLRLFCGLVSACLSVLYVYFISRQAYDFVFGALLATTLMLAVSGFSDRRGMATTWVRRLIRYGARYSFVLFLTHYSLIEVLLPATGSWNPWSSLALFVIVSNALAAVMTAGTVALQRWLRRRLRSALAVEGR